MILIQILLLALVASAPRSGPPPPEETAQLRRPVALALLPGNPRLYVANERSGTVTILGRGAAPEVIAEVRVGRRLTDLEVVPGRPEMIVLDGAAHQLIRLRCRGDELLETGRRRLPPYPSRLQITRDGTLGIVSSTWSRSVSFVDLVTRDSLETVALSFAPRELLLAEGDSRLIVADAFGGHMAVLDVERREIESTRELPAHNIRGLALTADGQQLILSHQRLNRLARTGFDDVHWGVLLTNHLRLLDLRDLLDHDPDRDPVATSQLQFLGEVGRGAADPAAVLTDSKGNRLVALSGVSEIGIIRRGQTELQRLRVGRYPTALLADPRGDLAYVANTFSDSVSAIQLGDTLSTTEVSLGPSPELDSAGRGELLFHEARLAHDQWFSCHSCHPDGHSNGLVADTLGDGAFGNPKRVLSLRGVGETGPWGWTGSMSRLEDQLSKTIETTMHGNATTAEVADLAAFLHTLPPPPPLRVVPPVDPALGSTGQALFEDLGCGECHAPPIYTSDRIVDVGLADELGNRAFNPPSLRGVAHREAFFHDRRARSLEAVFTEHEHRLDRDLSPAELARLVRFLRSL